MVKLFMETDILVYNEVTKDYVRHKGVFDVTEVLFFAPDLSEEYEQSGYTEVSFKGGHFIVVALSYEEFKKEFEALIKLLEGKTNDSQLWSPNIGKSVN